MTKKAAKKFLQEASIHSFIQRQNTKIEKKEDYVED